MKAYKNTLIHWSKSQTGIVKLLTFRKIHESRFTNLEDRFALEFRVVENGISKPLAVRIVVPFQTSKDDKGREQELNRLHRVLFTTLKPNLLPLKAD